MREEPQQKFRNYELTSCEAHVYINNFFARFIPDTPVYQELFS